MESVYKHEKHPNPLKKDYFFKGFGHFFGFQFPDTFEKGKVSINMRNDQIL